MLPCCRLLVSHEGDFAPSKVNEHSPSSQEINAKKTVNARARRQCVGQHREIVTFLPECIYPCDGDAGGEFHSTAGRYLDPVRGQRGVIPHGDQRGDVDHRPGGPGVQCQTQDDAPERAKDFGVDDNETVFGETLF